MKRKLTLSVDEKILAHFRELYNGSISSALEGMLVVWITISLMEGRLSVVPAK